MTYYQVQELWRCPLNSPGGENLEAVDLGHDSARIHIMTAATLHELGGANPDGFRPNIIVDRDDDAPFAESKWAGRVIAIGPEVRIRITTTSSTVPGAYGEIEREGRIRLGHSMHVL